MILPGLNSPIGSISCLMARKASFSAGPNCQAIHSPRHSPSPCSPLKAPLYLRTSAPASSAMARILAAPSRRMSRIGPHMQGADRGMGIPGAVGAVAREHLGQRRGIFRQMLQRHGAILDEADRFAVALQAHHDVEAGLAHLPQILLRRVVLHFHHAAGQAQIAHQRQPDPSGLAHQRRLCRRRKIPPAGWRRAGRSARVSMVGRKAGLDRLSSIMMRSTSSTALGPSLTICWAASIAAWKLGKLTTPSTLRPGQGRPASGSGPW